MNSDAAMLLDRMRNIQAIVEFVRAEWDDLLNDPVVTVGGSNTDYKLLFRMIMRAALSGAGDSRVMPEEYNEQGWEDGCGLAGEQWKDWYRKNEPLGLNDAWDKQFESLRFLVINYWNAAVHTPRQRLFEQWQPPECDPKQWHNLWEIYADLTEKADRDRFYTANHFLNTKAPRKDIIEWDFSSGNERPAMGTGLQSWIWDPPAMTEEIRAALKVRTLTQVETEGNLGYDDYVAPLRELAQAIQPTVYQVVDSLKKEFHSKAHPKTFGLYRGDVKALEVVIEALLEASAGSLRASSPIGLAPDLEKAVARYLTRLGVYLNVHMETSRAGGKVITVCQTAFMAKSLYEHYGPEAIAKKGEALQESWFYSVPVYVPLRMDGCHSYRISIVGMGTSKPLTLEELRLWRALGRQIVLPPMIADFRTDTRLDEALKQVPSLLHGVKRLPTDVDQSVANVYLFAKRKIVDANKPELMAKLDRLKSKAHSARARIIDLSELSKQIYVEKQAYPASEYCTNDVPDATPLREIIINGIRIGMLNIPMDGKSPRESPIQAPHAATTDSEIARWIAENDLKNIKWRVDFRGIDCLCVRKPLITNQQACWAILFEEWTANAIKGTLGDRQPGAYASIAIHPNGEGSLVCELQNGPVPNELLGNDARSGGRPKRGIGSMIIEWCVFGLSGCVIDDNPECFNRPQVSKSRQCDEWALEFTIRQDLWRPR